MIMWILVVLGVTRDLESGEIKVFSLLAKHTSNVSPRWQESMKDECLHRSIKTIMGLFYLELSSKGLVRQEDGAELDQRDRQRQLGVSQSLFCPRRLNRADWSAPQLDLELMWVKSKVLYGTCKLFAYVSADDFAGFGI